MSELEALFQPASIAVIGASPNPAKLGHVLLQNLIRYEFKGQIFPVNSQGETVLELKGYKTVSDIPSAIDLAVISIPNQFVYPVIQECAERGVRAAIILSSGFGEMGGEGSKTQKLIGEIRARTGMRVVGPNCMGVYNIAHRMNATYFWELPRQEGPLSFVSQSGAYGGIFFQEIKKRKLAISKFVSIGNMVDLDHADILDYLQDDPETKVIALFIEEIRDGKKFIATISRLKKPMIALKGGKTEAGRRAALSHTGSMAGSYEVFAAMCKQCGIILAENSDEFFDAMKAFLSNDGLLPQGNNTAILTISGGPSVITSDTCQTVGLNVPELTAKTKAEIRQLVPEFAALSNPVDMTPQINPANYAAVVDKVMSQSYIDSGIAINCGLDSQEFAQAFVMARQKYHKPIHAYSIANPKIEAIFDEHHIPIFSVPERTATAMKKLAQYYQFQQRSAKSTTLPESKPSPTLHAYLSGKLQQPRQAVARAMLREYGIPCAAEIFSTDEKEIVQFARQTGYPLVLKVAGDGIAHKTEKGGVITGIQAENRLKSSMGGLQDQFGKNAWLLVQKQIPDAVEIILGAHEDAVFGHVILVGIGGIYTELYQDVALGLCPVDKTRAWEMIQSLKGIALLEGFRGLPVIDKEMVAGLIVRLSSLIQSNPQIKELDINPLMINAHGAFAVDTLLVV